MLIRLFILFTIVPIIEVYMLIEVGGMIGAWRTVALLFSTSLAGAWLIRYQGFGILRRIQTEMAMGHLPAGELMNGAMILVGGALLLSPGFFTDFLGLFFLIPFTRTLIKRMIGLWFKRKLTHGIVRIYRL